MKRIFFFKELWKSLIKVKTLLFCFCFPVCGCVCLCVYVYLSMFCRCYFAALYFYLGHFSGNDLTYQIFVTAFFSMFQSNVKRSLEQVYFLSWFSSYKVMKLMKSLIDLEFIHTLHLDLDIMVKHILLKIWVQISF